MSNDSKYQSIFKMPWKYKDFILIFLLKKWFSPLGHDFMKFFLFSKSLPFKMFKRCKCSHSLKKWLSYPKHNHPKKNKLALSKYTTKMYYLRFLISIFCENCFKRIFHCDSFFQKKSNKEIFWFVLVNIYSWMLSVAKL
jgi:hypothetical protein